MAALAKDGSTFQLLESNTLHQDIEQRYAELRSFHALPVPFFLRSVVSLTLTVLIGPTLCVIVSELGITREAFPDRASDCTPLALLPVFNVTHELTGKASKCPKSCEVPRCSGHKEYDVCEADGACKTSSNSSDCCREPGFYFYRDMTKESRLIGDLFSPSVSKFFFFVILPIVVVLIDWNHSGLFAPQDTRQKGSRNLYVFFCPVFFALVFLCLPIVATLPFNFLQEFFVEFKSCKHLCDALDSSDQNVTPAELVNETITQCRESGMMSFMMPSEATGAPIRGIRCMDIFKATPSSNLSWDVVQFPENTTSIDAFNYFSRNAKVHYMISDWDLFGSWVGIYDIVLLMVGQLILWSTRNKQAEELEVFIRDEFNLDGFATPSRHSEEKEPNSTPSRHSEENEHNSTPSRHSEEKEPNSFYRRLISMKDFLQDESAFAGARRLAEDALDIGDGESIDIGSGECALPSMSMILMIMVVCVGGVSIPAFKRWLTECEYGPLLQDTAFFPLIMWTGVLELLRRMTFFFWFINHLTQFSRCKRQVLAFDMLWCFPGRDREIHKLVTSNANTYMSLRGFLVKATALLHHAGSSPSDEVSTLGKDMRMSNRVDFSIVVEQDLFGRLRELEKWLAMRRFIQLHQLPKRLRIEVAVMVALLTVLPKVASASVHFFFFHRGKEHGFPLVSSALLLWDLVCMLVLIFLAMLTCSQINERFDDHFLKLQALEKHVGLQKVRATLEPSLLQKARATTEDGDSTTLALDDNGTYVASVLEMAQFVDEPCLLFGQKVSNSMLAKIFAAGVSSIMPSLFSMFAVIGSAMKVQLPI